MVSLISSPGCKSSMTASWCVACVTSLPLTFRILSPICSLPLLAAIPFGTTYTKQMRQTFCILDFNRFRCVRKLIVRSVCPFILYKWPMEKFLHSNKSLVWFSIQFKWKGFFDVCILTCEMKMPGWFAPNGTHEWSVPPMMLKPSEPWFFGRMTSCRLNNKGFFLQI